MTRHKRQTKHFNSKCKDIETGCTVRPYSHLAKAKPKCRREYLNTRSLVPDKETLLPEKLIFSPNGQI